MSQAFSALDLDTPQPGDDWQQRPQRLGRLPSWRLDVLRELWASAANGHAYDNEILGLGAALNLDAVGGVAYSYRSATLSNIAPGLRLPESVRFDQVGWGRSLSPHWSVGLSAGLGQATGSVRGPNELVGMAGLSWEAAGHRLESWGLRDDRGLARGSVGADGPLFWSQGYRLSATAVDGGGRAFWGGIDVRHGLGALAFYDGAGHWDLGLGWVRDPRRFDAVRVRMKAIYSQEQGIQGSMALGWYWPNLRWEFGTATLRNQLFLMGPYPSATPEALNDDASDLK